jgi:uncharacterized protein YqjF (DUF2071 family)
MKQRWESVCFLHYRGPSEVVAAALPHGLEPDLFEGEAVLSLVPFRMSQIRPWGLPALPGLSSLWEYNLRTYVRRGSARGIYFFTLDTDSRMGAWIGRTFYRLPYAHARLKVRRRGSELCFEHERDLMRSRLILDLRAEALAESAFHAWSTERYSLFTADDGGTMWRGDVQHDPWSLRVCDVRSLDQNLLTLVPGAPEGFAFAASSWAEALDVSFRPFRRC